DEAAASLAARFAGITRDHVGAHGGQGIELRGDEALVVFTSARQGVRAALDLQAAYVEATEADPSLPMLVWIGLAAGGAVPLEGGFRGGALNLAARLCSQAAPGEVLASPEVVHLARTIPDVTYQDRAELNLKGLDAPVRPIAVAAARADGQPDFGARLA